MMKVPVWVMFLDGSKYTKEVTHSPSICFGYYQSKGKAGEKGTISQAIGLG
jgi:hypothetical protein